MGIRGRQNIHKLLVSPVPQCHLLSYGASSAVETVGDAVGRRGIIFFTPRLTRIAPNDANVFSSPLLSSRPLFRALLFAVH